MKTHEDIEAYLARSGLHFQGLDAETWLVRIEEGVNPVIVHIHGPVVVARADVGPAPKTNREAVFAGMLRENADALMHCSYGLSGDKVILSGAMPLENLDYNEFVSTLDDMALALGRGVPDAGRKA